jgi:hypothetical protein
MTPPPREAGALQAEPRRVADLLESEDPRQAIGVVVCPQEWQTAAVDRP